MKNQNKDIENNNKEDVKSLDDYIQLYTEIVRELSENLKCKTDMIDNILNNQTDLYKTLKLRKKIDNFRNQTDLFKI